MATQQVLAALRPVAIYTKALLHFDGADGSTTITDDTGKTWTASGNAQIDTAQSKFGGSSLYVDGTGDFVSPTADPDFALGTGDFCVEGWIRPNSVSGGFILYESRTSDLDSLGFILYVRSTGKLTFGDTTGGVFTAREGPTTVTLDQWHHVELSRASGTLYMFLNGALELTRADSRNFSRNNSTRIGASWSGGGSPGHIDESRITKGLARHTSSFTPPSFPFVLD